MGDEAQTKKKKRMRRKERKTFPLLFRRTEKKKQGRGEPGVERHSRWDKIREDGGEGKKCQQQTRTPVNRSQLYSRLWSIRKKEGVSEWKMEKQQKKRELGVGGKLRGYSEPMNGQMNLKESSQQKRQKTEPHDLM